MNLFVIDNFFGYIKEIFLSSNAKNIQVYIIFQVNKNLVLEIKVYAAQWK